MYADADRGQPPRVFLPQMAAPKQPARLKELPFRDSAMSALAGAAGGTLTVALLDNWGGPGGLISDTLQSLPATALTFGGPLALGILATQMLDVAPDDMTGAAVASGIAVAGMMITNMIPRAVDMATLTTIAAAAVGVYGGQMLV